MNHKKGALFASVAVALSLCFTPAAAASELDAMSNTTTTEDSTYAPAAPAYTTHTAEGGTGSYEPADSLSEQLSHAASGGNLSYEPAEAPEPLEQRPVANSAFGADFGRAASGGNGDYEPEEVSLGDLFEVRGHRVSLTEAGARIARSLTPDAPTVRWEGTLFPTPMLTEEGKELLDRINALREAL